MSYGSGKYTYELVEGWAKLPAGWSFVDVGGISIDANDKLYILNRGAHPIIMMDREGNLLGTWGEGYFKRPHGSRIVPGNNIWCTDDGRHIITRFTMDGKPLQVLGNPDKPSDTGYTPQKGDLMASLGTIKAGGPPFNRPTGIARSSTGELFATDGYGNARVHKFSPEGKLIKSWGDPGTAPGHFNLPHNVTIDKYDRLWVPDRENNRIQRFDTEGKLLDIWYDVFRPTDVFIDKDETVYVSEIRPGVSIFTMDGRLLSRWYNAEKDPKTDLFISPHAIAVDSKGDIYVGEVAFTHSGYDRGARTIQKFALKR
jgi:DNA-binding beta-propeller fold protein YncE